MLLFSLIVWLSVSGVVLVLGGRTRKAQHCSHSLFSSALNAQDLAPHKPLESYVNTLGGTDSRYDLSTGSTLPLVSVPWGFDTFAPQTDDDSNFKGWWFHPGDRRFFGLRLTHQPSPWIQDYGDFLLKAYMPSDVNDPTASRDQFTSYSMKHSVFSPHYFSTRLNTYSTSQDNLLMEFSPVKHGGVLRATFPKFVAAEPNNAESTATAAKQQTRRVGVTLPINTDAVELLASPIDGAAMIAGYSTHNSGGVGDHFAHYFVMTLYTGPDGSKPVPFSSILSSSSAAKGQAWIDLPATDPRFDVITARLTTSFISRDQALDTLQQELPSSIGFEQVRNAAQQQWRSLLGRYTIAAAPEGYTECELESLYTVLYTSMYRSSLFPRQLTEHSSTEGDRHWSPYAASTEDSIKPGPLSTDSGFWDAWNTVYPLQSLLHRDQLATTMQGWSNAFVEAQWLPQWSSPGFRGSMVGTMSDVSLADAIVKAIPGIDYEALYAAIRKNAFEIPPVNSVAGRACMKSYLKLGYVPADECSESVARTLNYLQSDWAAAQAAKVLGKEDDYRTLTDRLSNSSAALFDLETGFFRGKHANGKFTEPFDQYAWGGDYTEGGPWQFRFYMPQDPQFLAQQYALSGRDLCTELTAAQTSSSTVHLGGYSSVIHEQTELFERCWGQYAHNNQPSHYMLPMFLQDGLQGPCSTQGRGWVRHTLRQAYRSGQDMFPGDEDNGEMSAWFVLGSLGLYVRSPGSDSVQLLAPLFGTVEVDLSDKLSPQRRLRIETVNNSPENVFITAAALDGQPLDLGKDSDSLDWQRLLNSRTLTLTLGPSPQPLQAPLSDLL